MVFTSGIKSAYSMKSVENRFSPHPSLATSLVNVIDRKSNSSTNSDVIPAKFLPAQDPVLKDQVLNGNITHSKHGHVTRKKDPVLNGECSPFKTGSFLLVT